MIERNVWKLAIYELSRSGSAGFHAQVAVLPALFGSDNQTGIPALAVWKFLLSQPQNTCRQRAHTRVKPQALAISHDFVRLAWQPSVLFLSKAYRTGSFARTKITIPFYLSYRAMSKHARRASPICFSANVW